MSDVFYWACPKPCGMLLTFGYEPERSLWEEIVSHCEACGVDAQQVLFDILRREEVGGPEPTPEEAERDAAQDALVMAAKARPRGSGVAL